MYTPEFRQVEPFGNTIFVPVLLTSKYKVIASIIRIIGTLAAAIFLKAKPNI
jgi:hypothetical protein